jgi:hypothetical protein
MGNPLIVPLYLILFAALAIAILLLYQRVNTPIKETAFS